jgi:hypothetical protein
MLLKQLNYIIQFQKKELQPDVEGLGTKTYKSYFLFFHDKKKGNCFRNYPL